MAKPALTILHIDMDAFYAAVEQRERPELRGWPVIVGGTGARGVVSAASYEARPFGVHSAMPMSAARRLCPDGVFLPVRIKFYAEVAQQLRGILQSFTPLVEPLSLDEAFLDVRGCEELFGTAEEIGRQLKERIQRETELVASVGVAPNKFLAKLASDLGKPNGFVVVQPDQLEEFLHPLPVGRLWGVGARGEKRLHALGLRTIGQLAALPEAVLVGHLGEPGRHLWQLAHGQDNRPVVPDREAKSISCETTFERDIDDQESLRTWLLDLVDQLATRLRQHNLRARSVELKVRSSDFHTRTRSRVLSQPTNLTVELWQAARKLLEQTLTAEVLPVRLLGVGGSKLTGDDAVQGDLFDGGERQRHTALDQALDTIRGKFGRDVIRRGKPHEKEG